VERYNLAFQGELLPGFDAVQARRDFASAFFIDDAARVEIFFTGRPVLLRRNLCKQEAASLFVTLRRIGLVTHIEHAEAASPPPAKPAHAAAAPRRRRRQPGAPNEFELKLSARALHSAITATDDRNREQAPLIAAALCLLALLLMLARLLATRWLGGDGGSPGGSLPGTISASHIGGGGPPLEALGLAVPLLLAAGFAVAAIYQRLGARLPRPRFNADEAGFDVANPDITWLDPAPGFSRRLRLLGVSLAALSSAALLSVVALDLGPWRLAAVALACLGAGALYAALWRSCRGHLGAFDDKVILVDHSNTYRVGSGPAVQYQGDFVMIDDVIVYLGNRLLPPFARETLRRQFQPLLQRGSEVDRSTLQLKLIEQNHPVWLGISALLACLSLSALLLLVG
jgi:hypothetical protein